MKKLLSLFASAFFAVSIANAEEAKTAPAPTAEKPNGMWTFLAGTARQKMESGAGAALGVEIDLYEVGALYRFNDGLMIGGKMQEGYPNTAFPTEKRYEALLGYSTRYKNMMPYVLAGYGHKKPATGTSGDFYWVKPGVKVMLDPQVFVSTGYRYRDSNDFNNMRDDTYYYGAGYNLTKDTTVEIEVGKVRGVTSSDSTVTSLIFSKRFF